MCRFYPEFPSFVRLKQKNVSQFLMENVVCTHIYEYSWKRYLDDCFVFCTKSLHDLQDFQHILNHIHYRKQFTMGISESELPVLHILIVKEERKKYYRPLL